MLFPAGSCSDQLETEHDPISLFERDVFGKTGFRFSGSCSSTLHEKGLDAMKVIDPGQIPTEQWRPGVETRMLVSARSGAIQLCMFEQWVAPGNGAPTHSHPVEEVLTVRAGEAEMWLDQERVLVRTGQSLIVPALRPHGFRNSGAVTLHVHAVLASPVFEATPEGANDPVRRWNVANSGEPSSTP
jgi:mannose-6-phosphate isomerase-like protein (cupin superfamily)